MTTPDRDLAPTFTNTGELTPHDTGCRCWPHVSERDALDAIAAVGLAEYRSKRLATPPEAPAPFLAFSCAPCWDFIFLHHANESAPHDATPPESGLDVDAYLDGISVMTAEELRRRWPASAARLVSEAVASMLTQQEAEDMAREALAAYRAIADMAPDYHHTGLIRDHADPTDKTGWNVKGIETCRDPLCVEAVRLLALIEQKGAPRECALHFHAAGDNDRCGDCGHDLRALCHKRGAPNE